MKLLLFLWLFGSYSRSFGIDPSETVHQLSRAEKLEVLQIGSVSGRLAAWYAAGPELFLFACRYASRSYTEFRLGLGGSSLANLPHNRHAGLEREQIAEFHYFNKLPAELRIKIWRYAMPGPRVIDISKLYIKHLHIESVDNSRKPRQHDYVNTRKPPALLHVSGESRYECLKFYELLRISSVFIQQQDRGYPRQKLPVRSSFYIDYERDNLFFDNIPEQSGCGLRLRSDGYYVPQGRELKKVRHFARSVTHSSTSFSWFLPNFRLYNLPRQHPHLSTAGYYPVHPRTVTEVCNTEANREFRTSGHYV